MSVLRTLLKCNSRFGFLTQNTFITERHYSSYKCITLALQDNKGYLYKLGGGVGLQLREAVLDTLDMPQFGICGGMPGCTTCHVIFTPEDYEKIKPPDSLEASLLRQTLDVTPTSRLACQTYVEECMEGMKIRLPLRTLDIRTIP